MGIIQRPDRVSREKNPGKHPIFLREAIGTMNLIAGA